MDMSEARALLGYMNRPPQGVSAFEHLRALAQDRSRSSPHARGQLAWRPLRVAGDAPAPAPQASRVESLLQDRYHD
jgi:hypothetical protein